MYYNFLAPMLCSIVLALNYYYLAANIDPYFQIRIYLMIFVHFAQETNVVNIEISQKNN